jgi:hypothetical protein
MSEAMGTKSKNVLNRYLQKIDKGESGVPEDGEIDPRYYSIKVNNDHDDVEYNCALLV